MNHKKKDCDKADPSYESCMRVFSKDLHQYVKPTIPHNHNIANRIKQYHYLRDKLSLLRNDDCLEKKKFTDGASGYTIRNIINLVKKIGTKSKYGMIYLTAIPSLANTYPIATKVMPYNMSNIYEVSIMSLITKDILLNKLSRHFLMIYGGCACSKRIAEKLKLISINELADGDLKMLINMKDVVGDTELMFNIFIQTYISIATFHNYMGYVHRDTHYGNFLYQTNTEKGYYHYIFNGKSYYLKSCPYNIMIYDFGFARLKDETRNSKIYVYRDYAKIINAFIKKSSRGWNKLAVLDKSLSETMIQFKRDLYHNIEGELDKDIIANTNTSSSYAYTQFSFIIENMFLKHAPQGMFITSRPPNVINAIPFRIDK
jgi:hypothetical protein